MNLRPLGPQPSALPSYATLRCDDVIIAILKKKSKYFFNFFKKIFNSKNNNHAGQLPMETDLHEKKELFCKILMRKS